MTSQLKSLKNMQKIVKPVSLWGKRCMPFSLTFFLIPFSNTCMLGGRGFFQTAGSVKSDRSCQTVKKKKNWKTGGQVSICPCLHSLDRDTVVPGLNKP